MIVRKLITILLCFMLAFPMNSWGGSNPLQNPLYSLLIQHRDIKSSGNMELLTKYGKKLSDATFKMMKDPKNLAFFSTPDGIELRKHQALLNNFLAVKDHLEKCVKNKDSTRKLNERIVQASFQSLSTTDLAVPCVAVDANKMVSSFVDFNNNIMKSMKTMIKPYFQNQLTKQIITNTAKSLLGYKVKFQADFMKNGVLSQKDLDEVIEKVCVRNKMIHARKFEKTDVCAKMDPQLKESISRELTTFSKTQKSVEKFTPEKAVISLNASIKRLNETLSKVEVKNDVGIIYDSANLKDEKTKKEFDSYIAQYMTEISKDAGTLLLSTSIRDVSGGMKRFDSSDVSKEKSKYQFIPHKEIKLRNVQTSIAEVERKIMSQARDTLDIASESTEKAGIIASDDDHISELVKINPLAGGQLLLKEPQYAGLMCDAINKINENDEDAADRDKYFTYGAGILGGALILSGVGAMGGAAIMSYVATGAFAVGATASAVMGATVTAGTAVELVSATYSGKRAYDYYNEKQRLEEAFLTNNGDTQNITDASKALAEYKEALLSATISLAGVGLGALSTGKLFNMIKISNGRVTPSEVSGAAKILNFVSQNAVAQRLKDVTKVLGDKGMEKLELFLFELQ
ncbi:MAG: hypothetical protein K2Q18_06735 [Bdellovibrionales bacterium]|nr:hypothetical protein [Bdellovibrionales bacterium]